MLAREFDAVVVGGGAFGTTLASILARQGRKIVLLVRRRELAEEINRQHKNSVYLPKHQLPEPLWATTDVDVCTKARAVLVVVPSRFFREWARKLGEVIEGDQVLLHATKGLEPESGKRMSQVLREETCAKKVGVISGPNLSELMMRGLPAGAVVASAYEEVVRYAQSLFAETYFRLYAGTDVTGVELAGTFKNIVALAAGGVDGLGLGENAKSLLLTRGFTEMTRFGAACGARPLTFAGLAGIGDLMATCFSDLSRNYRVGRSMAQGHTLDQVLASMPHVAEGVSATRVVHELAKEKGLELRIVRAVHGVLYEGWATNQAVDWLMANPVGMELSDYYEL